MRSNSNKLHVRLTAGHRNTQRILMTASVTVNEISHQRPNYTYTALPGNAGVAVNTLALFLFQVSSRPYRNMSCENVSLLFSTLNSQGVLHLLTKLFV